MKTQENIILGPELQKLAPEILTFDTCKTLC